MAVTVHRTGERPYTLRFTTAGEGGPSATSKPESSDLPRSEPTEVPTPTPASPTEAPTLAPPGDTSTPATPSSFYATKWVLDWKVGDVGFELRAPVEALSLEELLNLAEGVQPVE